MRTFLIITFLSYFSLIRGWSQSEGSTIFYTSQFTDLLESSGIQILTDSLDHYILTNKTNPYLKNTDLYLVNPQTGREYIVIIDENSLFPQLKFSSLITNLMNNENEHTVAFYSLDDYFILSELHADWAMDGQFIPKDQEDLKGYARSFYHSDSGVQVTVILLARELPILTTPQELSAIRFKE